MAEWISCARRARIPELVKRVVPTLGHLPVRMIINGAIDRAVHGWIADGCTRSTVKNNLAVLVHDPEAPEAPEQHLRHRLPPVAAVPDLLILRSQHRPLAVPSIELITRK